MTLQKSGSSPVSCRKCWTPSITPTHLSLWHKIEEKEQREKRRAQTVQALLLLAISSITLSPSSSLGELRSERGSLAMLCFGDPSFERNIWGVRQRRPSSHCSQCSVGWLVGLRQGPSLPGKPWAHTGLILTAAFRPSGCWNYSYYQSLTRTALYFFILYNILLSFVGIWILRYQPICASHGHLHKRH